MADQIQVQHTTSAVTLYAVIRNADGQVWNGAAFEAYLTANLGNYDVPLAEQGTASRYYVATMPSVAAGLYAVVVFQQAGGAPAETDPVVGLFSSEWDGSRFTRLGDPAGASLSADLATLIAGVTVTTNNDKTGYAIGTGGIASTAFGAGAIDSAAIAANAIGASELAQDAAREIADEVLDRDIAGGASGGVRNVRSALRRLRNRVAVAAGTATVYAENDTSAAWTAAVTRTAGNPVSEVDPT